MKNNKIFDSEVEKFEENSTLIFSHENQIFQGIILAL